MDQHSRLFIGLDVSKQKISVAVADGERGGEVRFLGDIPSDPASVSSIVQRLAKRGAKLHFCYEAGPTGYELYRQLTEMGHDCVVVAPALIPKRPGDRVKTNRRDAVSLARSHRAGELTAVWVPDRGHEAMRVSCAPAKQPRRRKNGRVSSFSRSCFAMAVSIRAAHPGRWRIGGGYRL